MKKMFRNIVTIVIIAAIILLSNWFVMNTSIATLTIFSFNNLFTYFGVLIGFSLTIYTFGLSMITDIKNNIEKLSDKTEEEKSAMISSLISGFAEIKQDIWLIFIAIIGIIYFGIAKEITNPFDWNVEQYKIPETINISFFIISTISMFDIMRTLFNLSEINLELIKRKS
jgi:hypothetical protein